MSELPEEFTAAVHRAHEDAVNEDQARQAGREEEQTRESARRRAEEEKLQEVFAAARILGPMAVKEGVTAELEFTRIVSQPRLLRRPAFREETVNHAWRLLSESRTHTIGAGGKSPSNDYSAEKGIALVTDGTLYTYQARADYGKRARKANNFEPLGMYAAAVPHIIEGGTVDPVTFEMTAIEKLEHSLVQFAVRAGLSLD